MTNNLATEFNEILPTISNDADLRTSMLNLIANEPISGKVTQGGNRLERFRRVLEELVNGSIDLTVAIGRVQTDIPRDSSAHSGSNNVFASGWEERLIRIQLSRFYNQAVMEKLMSEGEKECYVPHSTEQNPNSPCSLHLAGRNQNIQVLHTRLVKSYGQGDYSDRSPKIPDHPYCTHVVTRKL